LSHDRPVQLNLRTPARALAIVAHPDDAEFQCGATFAKWAAQGCVINHLVCTDGAKGTWDPQADTRALVATRRREQRLAADVLGSTGEVVFLDTVDGELEATLARRGEVAYWIRVLRPDVVLAHDPWQRWRLHPDHRAAGFLACDGIVAARDPHFYPEHRLPHHRPSTLLLFETEEPNHAEDVTGYADTKVDALLAHASQYESTMLITAGDRSQRAAFVKRIVDELAASGQRVGLDQAECFRRIDEL
jgi:LmbE family N-acetylglucosaminyl deacetylase